MSGEIAVQEPARVERVRHEPREKPARAQRVEERMRVGAELSCGRPGGMLGGEEPVELVVRDLDEAAEKLADHPRVLDLFEDSGDEEQRQIVLTKNSGRLLRVGRPSRRRVVRPASQPSASSLSSKAKWKSVSPQSRERRAARARGWVARPWYAASSTPCSRWARW